MGSSGNEVVCGPGLGQRINHGQKKAPTHPQGRESVDGKVVLQEKREENVLQERRQAYRPTHGAEMRD